MAGYGLAPADGGEGLLPWSWAVERLTASHGYWLATTGPDGRPHAAPLWAVWHDGAIWFSTGGSTRKVRNLATEPACTVTTESTTEAVIVEGRAGRSDWKTSGVLQIYAAKYGTGFPTSEPVYRVEPHRAFGFIDEGDRFGATATRWTF
jgi:hypothetical protein